MATDILEIARYADEALRVATTPDYPRALNGLQFENRSPIKGITAAVDFSSRAIQGAITGGSNLLIVHHGMFWGGLERIAGAAYRRQATLVEADIAVYSSHLPLDCHPVLGNNVLLSMELGLEATGDFARFENIFVGVSGVSDVATHEILRRADDFARKHGGTARGSVFGEARRTQRWAICTGAGASPETLHEARSAEVDTLIVGEGPHWTAVYAEDNDLAIIYAGHYATETLGVRALAKHLAEKFDLPWQFIETPTGL
jgi:dinuclear metal center YbgI/SA1388 family protein